MRTSLPILVLPCSAAKLQGIQPAKDKYKGAGYWGLARPALAAGNREACHLFVISAEFGLLAATDLVPDYDRKMTTRRVTELLNIPAQADRMANLLDTSDGPIYVACPALYRQFFLTLGADALRLRPEVYTFHPGGIGMQRQQLKQWLQQICSRSAFRQQTFTTA